MAAASLLHHPSRQGLEVGTGWLCISASFYVLNGLSDMAGDRANCSSRPLAAGALCPRAALAASVVLGSVGLIVCSAASPSCGVLALAFAVLGVAYSVGPRLKENAFAAAIAIGTGAGLTYVAGWSAGGSPSSRHVMFAFALSSWIAIACSTKDFSDVDGDLLAGRRTIATIVGVRAASRLIATLSAIAAGMLLALACIERFGVVPAAVVAIGTGALPYAGTKAAAATGRGATRSAYRVYMATQYAVNGSMMMLGTAA